MCLFGKSYNTKVYHYKRTRLMSWPVTNTDLEKLVLSQEVDSLKNVVEKVRQKVASLAPIEEKNNNTSLLQIDIKGDVKSAGSCKTHVFISELREIKSVLEKSNEIVDKNLKRGKVITSTVRKCFEKPGAFLNANENAKTKLGTMTENKFGSAHLDNLFVLESIPNITCHAMPVSLTSYFDSLSSGSTIGVAESMSNNLLRLSSFSTFPRHVNIFSSRFASAGFYFTGPSDTVMCYACRVSHSNWTSGDDPLKIHKRLSPNCPHLQNVSPQNITRTTVSTVKGHGTYRGTSERNSMEKMDTSIAQNTRTGDKKGETGTTQNNCIGQIPKGIGDTHNPAITCTVNDLQNEIKNNSTQSSTDINTGTQRQNGVEACCSQYENARNETSNSVSFARKSGYHEQTERSEFHRTSNISENDLTQTNQSIAASNICKPEDLEDVHNLGVNLEKPKYPIYAPIQVRISSYQNWPGYLDQTPKMMATAGFFYAGYNDYTRCFFCGGGLRNWEAGDDPWVEHARWFPKCAYLLQNKGSKFIRVVQEKHQQVMAKHQNTENTEYNLSMQNSIKTNQNQNITNGASSHPSGQNPLETVAARSVLEMGYTNDLVLQAMEKLKTAKKETTISATDIMAVLLEENLEGSNLSTYSSLTTQGLALERNSATQSTSDKNTLESTNAIKSEISATENQKRSSLQQPSSQGAFGETSNSNELSSALDDTEQLLEENRQLRDQRLCKVCLDLEACIAFLPCGHLVCCADCAPALRKCPICRARVKGTVKTFLI